MDNGLIIRVFRVAPAFLPWKSNCDQRTVDVTVVNLADRGV
jgi:hypothetical protein